MHSLSPEKRIEGNEYFRARRKDLKQLGPTSPTSGSLPEGGESILRREDSPWTGDLPPHSLFPGHEWPVMNENASCPTTWVFVLDCEAGENVFSLGDLYMPPPLCCLIWPKRGDFVGTAQNVSMLETLSTVPGSLYVRSVRSSVRAASTHFVKVLGANAKPNGTIKNL